MFAALRPEKKFFIVPDNVHASPGGTSANLPTTNVVFLIGVSLVGWRAVNLPHSMRRVASATPKRIG
jgi:hypothetical protein